MNAYTTVSDQNLTESDILFNFGYENGWIFRNYVNLLEFAASNFNDKNYMIPLLFRDDGIYFNQSHYKNSNDITISSTNIAFMDKSKMTHYIIMNPTNITINIKSLADLCKTLDKNSSVKIYGDRKDIKIEIRFKSKKRTEYKFLDIRSCVNVFDKSEKNEIEFTGFKYVMSEISDIIKRPSDVKNTILKIYIQHDKALKIETISRNITPTLIVYGDWDHNVPNPKEFIAVANHCYILNKIAPISNEFIFEKHSDLDALKITANFDKTGTLYGKYTLYINNHANTG